MKIISIILLIAIPLCLFLTPPCLAIDVDTSSYFLDPERSKKISMDFQNAPLVDVLKIFSQQTNLNMIASSEIANRNVTVYFDNVPVEQALQQILRANNLTYEIPEGSSIYIVRPIQRPNIELTTRVYPLKHASVQSAKINTLIQVSADENSGGRGGQKTDGGIIPIIQSILTNQGKITEDARTNSLIITDILTNFPMIDQTIARLDVSIPQVLIEVEMLEVAKSNADKIGIKWGDSPLVFTGGQKFGVFPFDGSIPFFDKPAGIDYEEARWGTSLMDAEGLSAIVQFLKSQTDTKNLARPRILTLNNQAAEIKIATDEAIGVQQGTESSEGLASQSYDAERVETGVFLIVTPQANIETGIITMAIQPKVTIAKEGAAFSGVSFKDPEERSAKTILKVTSGDTIIIGGLVREESTTRLTKVPLLGDLPIIGKAFRHTDIAKNERELIIFITPHILPDPKPGTITAAQTRYLLREQEAPVVK